MHSFSIVYFLLLTFCLLRSLSAVSNSFYLSFLYSSPSISRPLLIFLAFISPPLPGHLLSASFSSPIFLHDDQPMYSSPFCLRTFLQSSFHSHFIHLILSAFLTLTIIFTRWFSQTLNFSYCISVSAIVSSSFLYAGVTHRLSTFPIFCWWTVGPKTSTPASRVFLLKLITLIHSDYVFKKLPGSRK